MIHIKDIYLLKPVPVVRYWFCLLFSLVSFINSAQAGSLSFRFNGPDGNSLYVRAGGFFVSDLTLKPVAYMGNFSGPVTFTNLPDEPLLFNAYVDVPGFGDLDFIAANGGAGFIPNGQTIDVLYEVARHRYLAANGVMQQALADGYVFDSTVFAQMASAESYLTLATGSPAGSGQQANYALLSLGQSGPAAETIVVERGRQKLNQQGGLRADQLVSVFSLYNHREGQQWQNAMSSFFNCGVQWLQWQFIEQTNGSYNWNTSFGLDQTMQDLRNMSKKIRVQPGMWLNWLPAGWSWVSDDRAARVEQLRSHLVPFTHAMVSRYPEVRYWQSVSESDAAWSSLGFLEPEDIVSLSKSICQEVKAVNPDALNGINCTLLWGAHSAMNLNASPRVVSPYEHFEMLIDADTPFEFIVMQLYFNGRDIFEVDQMLEIYKPLDKKIGIESQCASAEGPMLPNCSHFPSGHPGQNYFTWHRDWDEPLQAEWLEKMFIVCLSKDYVVEWNWWDLAEYVDCYYPWGGLFDEHYNIKPSGLKLAGLLEQWGGPAFASCRVDENDIVGLEENWLDSGLFITADLNYDGKVDLGDLSKMARYWMGDCPDDWPWSDFIPEPPPPVGTVWDARDDWSDTNNPSGTWSYMNSDTNVLLVADPNPVSFVSVAGWSIDGLSTLNSVPAVWPGPTALDAGVASLDDLGIHGPLLMRWTSPANLTIEISGYMYQDNRIQPPERIMQWSLNKNGTTFSEGVVSSSNVKYDFVDGSGGSAALTQSVSAGDIIDLSITGNAPGSVQPWSTFAGFKETITSQ